MFMRKSVPLKTLKAPIINVSEDKFCDILFDLEEKKVLIFHVNGQLVDMCKFKPHLIS